MLVFVVEGLALRAVLAGLYAVVLWLSALAYQTIVGGPVLMLVLLGPVIVSGAMVVLVFFGFVGEAVFDLCKRWTFRGRSTFR